MGFKGNFSKYQSKRLAGTVLWSFTLKCTNLMFGESIDIGLFPSDGSQPWYQRDIKFKAGQQIIVNHDTFDWIWYQGDYLAIIDKNNRIIEKWVFQMKEYGPGECPECHGTHKCKKCHGEGFIYPPGRTWEFKTCPQCGGTGICQTCDIPRRGFKLGGAPTGLHPF